MSSGAPLVPLPFGLELLHEKCGGEAGASPFGLLILPVHWAVVSNTPLRILTKEGDVTELLANLEESIVTQDEEAGTRKIELTYKNVSTGSIHILKVLEVLKDEHVAVTCTERDSKQSNAITLDIREFVRNPQSNLPYQIYDSVSMDKLFKTVREQLLKAPEKVTQQATPSKSPYSSNLSASQEESLKKHREQERNRRYRDATKAEQPPPSAGGVGFIPPTRGIIPPGIGRSDLDPFGEVGSGMLMDPRGFRGGGVRQPRYDPIGPVGPGGMFRHPGRGGFGGRSPGLPFGMPNPDHERMPDGFEDMFM